VTITLNANGLQLNGQTIPVYSGTVHYWRLERSRWPLILDQVQALGFGMLETYIPWSVHETASGQYDWGQVDERKDIEAFMQLCEARGLWLLVRPGPLINAELTDFGFPEWVLLDPAVQARSAVGSLHLDAAYGLHPPRPFPVPSYASEAFYHAVGQWFDVVCPLIARHLAPHGCVVAVQSDNETCYLFHEQAYATDYSAASLRLYRVFLAQRYSNLEALNAAYGSRYTDFADVPPPRDCGVHTRADVPWHLDWVAYKEYQIRWSVVRLACMLRERGLGAVPIFHDVAYQYRTPLDIAQMEADPNIDWVGMNLYRNKEDYRGTTRRMRYLSGATRLPFVPEFGSGIWSHHPATPTPEEQEFITLSALMYGLKAFNFYMLVERERWQGSPIKRQGALRSEYARFYRQLLSFLHHYRFWQYERQRGVLVLLNYDLGRYAAMASTLNYAHADLYGLPPELFEVDLDLGLRGDPLAEAKEDVPGAWLHTLNRELESRGVDYDLADTHLGLERLSGYPLVCLSASDFMDADDQRRLLQYVEGGGTLLVGPEMPYLDPSLRPAHVLGEYLQAPGTAKVGRGRLIWVPPPDLEGALAALLPQPEYRCAPPDVDLSVHRSNGCTLLFAANPTPALVETRLMFAGHRRLRSAWGTAQTMEGKETVTLRVPAYTVQIWEAFTDHDSTPSGSFRVGEPHD
jgi:beta-galactosidase